MSLFKFVKSIFFNLCKPALYLAIKIFLTDCSSLFSVITPSFNAFFISIVLLSKSSGIKSISLPARSAATSADSLGLKSTTPFISIASVITNPLNLSFFFRIRVIIFFDNVDGNLGVFSNDGTSI